MKLFEYDVHIGEHRVLCQTRDIRDGAITTPKIADEAVTADKLAPGSVGRKQLAPCAVEDLTALQAELQGIIAAATAKLEELQAIDIDKPIPDEQIQADWNQSDNTQKDFIKNKPTIPTIPTIPSKLSDLSNDTNFITKNVNDLVNYYLKEEVYSKREVVALLSALAPGESTGVDYIVDVEEDGLYFVDEQGNIGVMIDEKGLSSISISSGRNVTIEDY